MSSILTGVIVQCYLNAFASLHRNEMELFAIKRWQHLYVSRDWKQLVVKTVCL